MFQMLEPKISYGDLIQVAVVSISVIWFAFGIYAENKALRREVEILHSEKARMELVDNNIILQHKTDISKIESDYVRKDVFNGFEETLREIKEDLKELKKQKR